MATPDYSPKQVKRIREAVCWSRKRLEAFAAPRLDAIRQYVGKYYGENAAPDKVPSNFIELAVTIHIFKLAAQAPQVLADTPHMVLKPRASRLELALNHLLRKIDFATDLQMAVLEAHFGVGLMKTGVEDDGRGGMLFSRSVSFDDAIFDMTATRWSDMLFVGDRRRVSLEEAQNNEAFDSKVRRLLKPTGRTVRTDGQETASELTTGGDAEPSDYEDQTELLDLYFPRERRLITLSMWQEDLGVLQVVELDHQPYRMLGYGRVPRNLLPVAPVSMWLDLHLLGNSLFRKFGRQADREKTITVAKYGAAKDAETIKNAADGEIVFVDNPESVRDYKYGGADPGTIAAWLQVKDTINWAAGNLDSLGGLGPSAETARAEQLINANASARIVERQQRTAQFVQDVIKDLAWLLWTDPSIEFKLIKRVPGTSVQVPVRFGPDQRIGSLDDYDITIDPYSLQHHSPAERLQLLLHIWSNVLMPSLGPMASQGLGLDYRGLLRKIDRWIPHINLSELIVVNRSPEGGQQGPPGMARPPQTRRTYERFSAGPTRTARDNQMAQMLRAAQVRRQ